MQPIKLFLCLCFTLLLIFIFTGVADAQSSSTESGDESIVYYFWGFCPICSKPEEHVGLFEDYPVKVEIYEVFHDPAGREKYDQLRDALGIETFGFPTVVYNGRYWLGFSETVQNEILAAIEASLSGSETQAQRDIITLPVIGEVDLNDSPILLTTVIIAFLDGFNPCSLFVLTFLLAIIVHSASRKKIFTVGLTFLIVTAAVYGFFILGILNIMIFVAQLFWIRNLVAAIVIFLGLLGIKDFFIFKQGVSATIPDSYKSKYYKQVRNVFNTESLIPMISATAVMALGIALIELPCTAGFPFIWSSIIAGLELSTPAFIGLFLIYILIYLSIELVLFSLAVIKMRSVKMTEERGRILKLVAGTLMLVLGLILLVNPEFMENILGLLITFSVSALLILLLYYARKLLLSIGRQK